jgi:hypothetical protein
MSRKRSAMNERFVLNAVIEAVPQWYEGTNAPWTRTLVLGTEARTICSHGEPTPLLEGLLGFVEAHLANWHGQLSDPVSPAQVAAVRRAVTLEWLRLQDATVDWLRLLAYMEYLKDRTHENHPLSRNLLITPGEGDIDITSLAVEKVMDPLAGGERVYLHVDPNLHFLGYEEITWDQIDEASEYTYAVDFLRPFSRKVAEGAYLAHLTRQREIVLLGREGLIAAERRNRWYVYDPPTLREGLVEIFGDYNVGCNLFEIVFDLSYKRHGALLVYDPDHTVVQNVINRESVLEPEGRPDEVRRMLSPAAKAISLGSASRNQVKRRLLMELAGLDGAVIFDAHSILAFGAMIRTHPDAGGVVGARTTAAVSAYMDGGTTVKVSSDGDVCILFNEGGMVRTRERAKLQFL